jgi:amino acid transporter
MTTYNGTGAPEGWNWCLSYLATAGILIGFDASGHVAEETKNASINAAKGIFWSTVVSGIGGFITIILFLFCAVSIHALIALADVLILGAWCRDSIFIWISTAVCAIICRGTRTRRSCFNECGLHHCLMVCQFPNP